MTVEPLESATVRPPTYRLVSVAVVARAPRKASMLRPLKSTVLNCPSWLSNVKLSVFDIAFPMRSSVSALTSSIKSNPLDAAISSLDSVVPHIFNITR